MAIIGKLLKNRRAGDHNLAWELENLRGGASFELTSPDFGHETTLDPRHASKRIGGQDLSPALAWSTPPEGTAQLLLVVEDPDAPMGLPFVHALALLDPALTALPRGGLTATNPAPGVELLRSGWGSGYTGPAPVKSHGPHRYAFQLFALTEPLTTVNGKSPAGAKPRDVMSAAVSHARARTDGFYERP
ncbi:YbhB/YbcL family Raf kinase inhibitor-like protein [Nocardia sp. NEAU-G5]|uniref:YbhB/YbcL family Raf kinase inhibitor-like protein n=1 Tax=Nocardia albiluteola TaxID=2842303 RepID=A0ABS6B8X2_9NOCA|nr:YbhB/YbcL family Raf kinase inhibitor-like protein [Nocardia albiluteola]MBU3066754.1 YbhB/YbcL family Raf kinase inhibitor-like protein [Nocardia albiluteola]